MEINEALCEWYVLACSRNVLPGGLQLIEKVKEIAERLGKSKFSDELLILELLQWYAEMPWLARVWQHTVNPILLVVLLF